MEKVHQGFAILWLPQVDWEIFPSNLGFYVFLFTSPDDHNKVLLELPWVLDAFILAIGPQIPLFRPFLDSLSSVVVWLCLPDLPPALWYREALELIVQRAGRLVKLDQATESLSKSRFTRVAMEVDLSHPLVLGADVGVKGEEIPNFWQTFEYEHIQLVLSALWTRATVQFPSSSLPCYKSSLAGDTSSEA